MLCFPASKLLVRSLNLLKGAFLYITGGEGSVYSKPANQRKKIWGWGQGEKRKNDISQMRLRSVFKIRMNIFKYSDYRAVGIYHFFFFRLYEIYRSELIHLICLRGFCLVSSLHRFLLFRSTYVMFRIPDTVYHKLLRCPDLVCILHRGLFQVFQRLRLHF